MDRQEQIKLLKRVLDKDSTLPYEPFVIEVMKENKSSNYLKRVHKIENPLEYIDPKKTNINPNASQQMKGLWKSLGLESDVLTPAKEESFSTPVLKELVKTTSNETTREIIQQVLYISSTQNLLNQYLPKMFTNYEGNSKCSIAIKFPGTLSFRCSSAVGTGDGSETRGIPIMTLPKVIKTACIAPEGFIIADIDFIGLEAVVGASLTHDPNRVGVFTKGLDVHCLNASTFFTERVEEAIGMKFDGSVEFNKEFNRLRKIDDSVDKLRTAAKSPFYLLDYGGYPTKLSKNLCCPLKEAEGIFDKFHNELYKKSTEYKLGVIEAVKVKGYVHLGMGARLSSKNPSKDARSLVNASFQFWSILTLLSITRLKRKIEESGYGDDIFIFSTVHDSLTAQVRENPTIIKWYNDTLVEIMSKDFILNQEVSLGAQLEIGRSYTTCVEIPNNCSIEMIENTLKDL